MLNVSVEHRLGDLTLSIQLRSAVGVTALFGRSGCGKTTLINILAGLETPQQGYIQIGDTVLFDSSNNINLPPELRRIGYVFQDSRLFPHLSVEKNLTYGLNRVPATQRRHTLDDIVELLALSPLLNRRPETLSGGEKQRVAIGRALLSNPDILLMDEPLASLDAPHRAEILPFIEQLRDEVGIPIVYVSHSLDEVIRLADSIAIMSDGQIAASGPVEEVMSRLDLRPLTGRYEAGAVIRTTVLRHDEDTDLTELSCAAGIFTIPRINQPPGSTLRLRVRARDVSLATEKPLATSVLNVFHGRIQEMEKDGIPSQTDILIDIGVPVIARITRRSVRELGLAPGTDVYVMVKAASIDRQNSGMREH